MRNVIEMGSCYFLATYSILRWRAASHVVRTWYLSSMPCRWMQPCWGITTGTLDILIYSVFSAKQTSLGCFPMSLMLLGGKRITTSLMTISMNVTNRSRRRYHTLSWMSKMSVSDASDWLRKNGSILCQDFPRSLSIETWSRWPKISLENCAKAKNSVSSFLLSHIVVFPMISRLPVLLELFLKLILRSMASTSFLVVTIMCITSVEARIPFQAIRLTKVSLAPKTIKTPLLLKAVQIFMT